MLYSLIWPCLCHVAPCLSLRILRDNFDNGQFPSKLNQGRIPHAQFPSKLNARLPFYISKVKITVLKICHFFIISYFSHDRLVFIMGIHTWKDGLCIETGPWFRLRSFEFKAIFQHRYTCILLFTCRCNMNTLCYLYRNSRYKDKRSWERLMFIMGILIPGKTVVVWKHHPGDNLSIKKLSSYVLGNEIITPWNNHIYVSLRVVWNISAMAKPLFKRVTKI